MATVEKALIPLSKKGTVGKARELGTLFSRHSIRLGEKSAGKGQ